MTLSVNTNIGAMTALQHFNSTNRSLDITQLRVTTGLKVNGPKDDASSYAIAQTMRGDLAGLRAVGTALAQGQAIVNVAIDAAQSMSDLLLEVKAKVVQANQAGLDATSRTALNDDVTSLSEQIDTIASSADFNGINLIKSSLTTKSTNTGVAVNANAGWVDTGIAVATGDVVQFSASGTVTYAMAPALTATPDGPSVGAATHESNTLVPDENAHSLVGRVGTTSVADTTGFAVNAGSTEIATAGANLILGFNDTVVNTARSGYDAPSLGDNSGSYSVNVTVSSVDGFSVLSTVDGDSIAIDGHYLTATSLGLDSLDLTSFETSRSALKEIDKAIVTVNNALTALGSSAQRLERQEDFTVGLFDIVTFGVANLVDADMAEESARLQALQVKRDLTSQALSIANSAPQAILSLFNG